MWVYIFILLLQLGELIDIQLVGTISIAGIFYVCWFAYDAITGAWNSELRSGLISKISLLYLCLFSFQLLSEIIVGNEFSNILKGLAVTALSYMKLMCLWPLVKKCRHRITWLFICMSISGLIDIQFLSDEEFVMDSSLEGAGLSIFKLKIAPLVGELLVVCSLLLPQRNLIALLSSILGAGCAVLGARSTGLMIFLTGAIVFVINQMSKSINRLQVILWSCLSCIIGYGLFVLYVSAVLNGTIVGGNSKKQFANVENPYNPLYILLSGRSESPASLSAIKDSPFVGFGAWTKDPRNKYHKIKAKYQGNRFVIYKNHTDVIPSHSVVLGTGVNEGVISMLFMIMILWTFISKGLNALYKDNKYNYLLLFCVMQLVWHGLFSPVSHFRNEFPVYFCCCLFGYRMYMLNKILNDSLNINNAVFLNSNSNI